MNKEEYIYDFFIIATSFMLGYLSALLSNWC